MTSTHHQNDDSEKKEANVDESAQDSIIQMSVLTPSPFNMIKLNVVDAVFRYYQDLLNQLTVVMKIEKEKAQKKDETLIEFTNFYLGLKHSLELELNYVNVDDPASKPILHGMIQRAKHQLFRQYYQEVIQYHQHKKNDDLAQQLQYLCHPFDQVIEDDYEAESGASMGTSAFEMGSPATRKNMKDNSTMFPIASLYQMVGKGSEAGEGNHLLSSARSNDSSKNRLEKLKNAQSKVYRYLAKFLPFLVWLPNYRHHISDLKNDIIAGITVGVMVIPQGMAYSLIAGMPPVYGLYTVMIPTIIYAFLGTSRQLAIGPTAVSALMVSSSLQQLGAKVGSESDYIAFAVMFAMLGGLIQLLMGVFRLGFLVNFLSHPVLSGFTSAAAIIIAASQLHSFLGVHLPKDNRIQFTLLNVAKSLPDIHFPTLALGLCSLGFLHFIDHLHFNLKADVKFTILRKKFTIPKKISFKWLPGSLLLVVVGILSMLVVQRIGGYDSSNKEVFGIEIVGKVPSGIRRPKFPRFTSLSFDELIEILYLVLPVMVMGFMESISTAKYYAAQRGYEIDPNQELIAIGSANLFGSLFQSFTSTGSLCRTSVNAGSGATTQLAGFITGTVVLLTLLVLTPLFYYLPMPVLAALVIHSALHIPDFETLYFTYKTKGRDCALLMVALIGTLFIGILEGILIAAVASLVLVVFLSSRPSFCLLTRVPGTTAYHELPKEKEAKEIPGVLIARFDADIYFANVQYFKDRVKKFIKKSKHEVFAIVLDCGSISQVDSTAVSALIEIKDMLDRMKIELYYAQMKRSIQKVIKGGGLYERVQEHCFVLLHDAVLHAESVARTRHRLMRVELKRKEQNNSDFSSYEEDV